MTLKWQERSRIWLPCGRKWWRMWFLMNQRHFLITCTWDALNGNAIHTKILWNSAQIGSNHVFLLGQLKNYQDRTKHHAKTKACPIDMAGYAEKCEERYCELANKKAVGIFQSFKSLLGGPSCQKAGAWISWRIVRSMLTSFLEMLVLGTNW